VKHLIYTEKSNISFENYESNYNSCCSINCCSRTNDWYMQYQNNEHWHGAALAAVATFSARATGAAVASAVAAGAAAWTTKQLTFFYLLFL
jgi:hypothetical protein